MRRAATIQPAASKMSPMSNEIPSALRGQKYISLTTFRKTGAGVATPVWFGEEDGKLYVMTMSNSGKSKRIRNNPQVRAAPCTIRGKVTGPDSAATARLLPKEDFARARKTITRKYWMAWLTQPFSRADAFVEVSFD
jgi:PPOX class probable F420-dependent enzyme